MGPGRLFIDPPMRRSENSRSKKTEVIELRFGLSEDVGEITGNIFCNVFCVGRVLSRATSNR